MAEPAATPPPIETPPNPIAAAFRAMLLGYRGEGMDLEAAGDADGAGRATRYHRAILGIEQRWNAGEASPVRTPGKKG